MPGCGLFWSRTSCYPAMPPLAQMFCREIQPPPPCVQKRNRIGNVPGYADMKKACLLRPSPFAIDENAHYKLYITVFLRTLFIRFGSYAYGLHAHRFPHHHVSPCMHRAQTRSITRQSVSVQKRAMYGQTRVNQAHLRSLCRCLDVYT